MASLQISLLHKVIELRSSALQACWYSSIFHALVNQELVDTSKATVQSWVPILEYNGVLKLCVRRQPYYLQY